MDKERKKKLNELSIFLKHLQEQESGLRINNGLNEKGKGFFTSSYREL